MSDKSILEMTKSELRDALEPYGVPYRLSMNRSQLQRALTRIRQNIKMYGAADPDFNKILAKGGTTAPQ